MSKKPRTRYTTEFKAQEVELLATGKPIQHRRGQSLGCRRLSILFYCGDRPQRRL